MNKSSEQPNIVVVGSSSVDLVLSTSHLPKQNETVIAENSESFFGGKGANQSVACARLGANVYFVGCVGMDPLGQQILRNLVDENVNVGFVYETEEAATGTAYVTTANGQNSIVVVPAANYCITTSQISDAEKHITSADLVLLQLEIPMEIVDFTAQLTLKVGKKYGLYASPAKPLSQEIIDGALFIFAKRDELSILFGAQESENILKKYPNKLFIRDTSNSITYFDGAEMKYVRNDPSAHYYKMGMGDACTAGFAIAYCHGNSISDCVNFANKVALLASKKRGSQQGFPLLKDLIGE